MELSGRRILQTNYYENRTAGIIASKTHWSVLGVGSFAAITGSFRFSYAYVLLPGFMIMGAIIQGRFPRLGRVLICAGAIALSYWVFVVNVFLLIDTCPTHPFGDVVLT